MFDHSEPSGKMPNSAKSLGVPDGILNPYCRRDGLASLLLSRARAHASFSAGNLSMPARAINASDGRAVWRRVPGDIEIGRFAGIRVELRLR